MAFKQMVVRIKSEWGSSAFTSKYTILGEKRKDGTILMKHFLGDRILELKEDGCYEVKVV